MANTCTICRHPKRGGIETAMAKGGSLRDIARQFSIDKSAVCRHQKCIAEALLEARKARIYTTSRNIDEELERLFAFSVRLLMACHEWLLDPENPDKYTLEARDGDILVIYKEYAGENKNGNPYYEKKKASLFTLLQKVEGKQYLVQSSETRFSDPRKLILQATKDMRENIDRLARLTGAYNLDDENPQDKRRKREILIEAMMLVYQQKGMPKSRAEVEAEIDASVREVDAVWREAERLAISKGYIN